PLQRADGAVAEIDEQPEALVLEQIGRSRAVRAGEGTRTPDDSEAHGGQGTPGGGYPAARGPRPTRASWRLCATRRPALSQTSASSSNQPPLTCRQRAATRSTPGAGTARMYQVSSTVGDQPTTARPKTAGGSESTARASRQASGSRGSRSWKYPRISGRPDGWRRVQPTVAGSSRISTYFT